MCEFRKHAIEGGTRVILLRGGLSGGEQAIGEATANAIDLREVLRTRATTMERFHERAALTIRAAADIMPIAENELGHLIVGETFHGQATARRRS